jgi:drug/metabolite transporter (DMT)-like permease
MILIILTVFTLVAFAANSLLCRIALGGDLIDPLSFTSIRLASGALALIPLSGLFGESTVHPNRAGSWISGFALFAYAAAFSLAYVSLTAGMGALILFASVQVTMIGTALKSGEKPAPVQWIGSVLALGGLVYLVSPGISAPDPYGAILMCFSGIAWGVYSIRGKDALAPVRMTAGNFSRSALFALVVSLAALSAFHLQLNGILFALLSGVVTSGLGYVFWYKALRSLTTTQAAVVQLLVPVLAAFGGVVLLAEQLSLRLVTASTLILGGVSLAVADRNSKAGPNEGVKTAERDPVFKA